MFEAGTLEYILEQYVKIRKTEKANILTDDELRIIILSQIEHNFVKAFYEKKQEVTKTLVELNGEEYFFQDSETGVVYKTSPKVGTYVSFSTHEIKRTRFEGEKAGSLGMPEAREKGFKVEGK